MEQTRNLDASTLEGLRRAIGAVCWAVLRDPEWVEDAIQQTMLRLLEGQDAYDPSRPLRPWALRVARNVAIDHLRTRGRAFDADVDAECHVPPAEVPLIARERRQRLDRAIEGLAPSLRLVLVLSLVEELPGHEISALLGLSREAVWMRLSRARTELRRICHDEDL